MSNTSQKEKGKLHERRDKWKTAGMSVVLVTVGRESLLPSKNTREKPDNECKADSFFAMTRETKRKTPGETWEEKSTKTWVDFNLSVLQALD